MYYSIFDKQTGSYLYSGRDSVNRDEAVKAGYEFMNASDELEDEDWQTDTDLKLMESRLNGIDLIIEEHSEPIGEA